ncbi:hypothetical protein ACET3Z_028058 [Daucus carota]
MYDTENMHISKDRCLLKRQINTLKVPEVICDLESSILKEYPIGSGKALQFIYSSKKFNTSGELPAGTATTDAVVVSFDPHRVYLGHPDDSEFKAVRVKTQVSEEVERALVKLGPARLSGRYDLL